MFTAVKAFDVKKAKDDKKTFEFLNDSNAVANIHFPNRWKKAATIQLNGNKWQISRKGWWKKNLEVISEQSPYTKWKILISWRGQLSFRGDDNKLYTLKRKGFWKTCWTWLNEKDEPVIELKPSHWSFKKWGTIEFASNPDEKLLLLAMVGWFVVKCEQDDSAAVAVSSAA